MIHWCVSPERQWSSSGDPNIIRLSVCNLTKRSAELIVSSVQPFMGDNYCDAINNRAFCNYDGGDCCQSTVKTKKVSGAALGGSFWICSDLQWLFAL